MLALENLGLIVIPVPEAWNCIDTYATSRRVNRLQPGHNFMDPETADRLSLAERGSA